MIGAIAAESSQYLLPLPEARDVSISSELLESLLFGLLQHLHRHSYFQAHV